MPDDAPTDPLVTYLASTDHRCPACAYTLRGAPSARCPECGERITLRVASASVASMTWWLAGLAACALTMVLVIVELVHDGRKVLSVVRVPGKLPAFNPAAAFTRPFRLPWASIGFSWAWFAITAIAIAWLLADRRTFATRSGRRPMWIGLVLLLTPLIMLGSGRLFAEVQGRLD